MFDTDAETERGHGGNREVEIVLDRAVGYGRNDPGKDGVNTAKNRAKARKDRIIRPVE